MNDESQNIKSPATPLLQNQTGSFLDDHYHNGFDMSRINFSDIYQKKLWVHHTVVGSQAAVASNYGVFWITPVPCVVNTFQEVHQVAGTDGSPVTLMLEKLTTTVAPDSGVAVLGTTISIKSTANVIQSGTITTTFSNRTLATGDRLCLKDAGTLTAVTNVTVLVEIIVV